MKKIILCSLLIVSGGQLFAAAFGDVAWGSDERLLGVMQKDKALFKAIIMKGITHDHRISRVKKILSEKEGWFKKKSKEDMPNINAKNSEGWTPLMLAVTVGSNKDLVDLLIKSGANVNAKDVKGNTILMQAVRDEGTIENIRVLLEAKVSVNDKNDRGFTALMWAIREYVNTDVKDKVELLLEAGAEVNAQDESRGTAYGIGRMEIGSWNENHPIAKLLLQAGADPEIKSDYELGRISGENTKAAH
jgi:ankyrin repeat protein